MIRIITDSTSDITQDEAKMLQIDVIPLTVSFGEENFADGITITNDEFYSRLRNCKELPKTSQANPFDFEGLFADYIENGDEIISIHLSSELSGTYQSACIAASGINNNKITVIDSKNVTGALGLLVRIAVKMRDDGASYEETVKAINDLIPRTRLFVAIDTLEYLKKGGRISSSVAFVGEAISLHPVIALTNGNIDIAGKVIGNKCTLKWFLKQIKQMPIDEGFPILVGHSDAPEKATALAEKMTEAGVAHIDGTVMLGSVVGTYAGPNAVGVFYIGK